MTNNQLQSDTNNNCGKNCDILRDTIISLKS